jgi:biopolymer transport protein ExbD
MVGQPQNGIYWWFEGDCSRMSGSVRGGPKVEPNLTPILDMVFQLITFFMLVINFKAAEIDMSLQLPVLASAKPLPKDANNLKMLVLNVQVAVKCPRPGCDALAILVRDVDENKKVTGYHLRCEKGHEEKCAANAVADGRTCVSVYGRLLCKEKRDKDIPSISDYLSNEADLSLLAAHLTRDEVIHEGKPLPDIVVIRADTTCRFGAVNYVITEAQRQGYRKFALKTSHNDRTQSQ